MLAAFCFTVSFFFPEALMPAFEKGDGAELEDADTVFVSGKVYKTQEKTYSVYVYLKNAKASKDGENFFNAGRILLIIPIEDHENIDLRMGNTVYAECSYDEFDKARNNGNFDEENYYRSLGIFLKASEKSIQITDPSVRYPAQLMACIKEKIIDSLDKIMGRGNEAIEGIFTAIVTGDRSALTDGTKSLYSENGIFHILAVSGLHISLIGMGLFSLLRKCLGMRKSCIVSGAVIALYCIMCGLSVSAMRAAIMFSVRMGAYFFGKTYDLLSALSLAAMIILLSNPFYVLNSGFVLSFSAILSIGVVNKNLTEFLKPKRKITGSLLSSACVSICLMPVIAYIYFAVPLYGVLLNLIVIPLMSIVLSSGIAGAAAGIISAYIGRLFIGLGYYTVYFINFCCYIASLLPYGSIVTGSPPVLKIIIFYLILLGCVYLLRQINLKNREEKKPFFKLPEAVVLKRAYPDKALKKIKKHIKKVRYAAVIFVITSLALIICVNPESKDLEIIMFDVDQGDGILIKTPEGITVMIDGGSTGESGLWQYRLESALEYEAVTVIDYAVITHPDTDHISGIEDLLSDDSTPVSIKNLLIPYFEDNDSYEELVSLAEEAGVNVLNIYSGMVLQTKTVTFTCIHPDEGVRYEDANEMSAVISLEYGDFTALFTGDIGEDTELEIIEKGCLPEDYDLLKVAHHGSKYSSCEEFLEAVSPDIAIISAGIDNSYGHPADETLVRLEEAGADIYVTAVCGEIKITVDETGTIDIWTKF